MIELHAGGGCEFSACFSKKTDTVTRKNGIINLENDTNSCRKAVAVVGYKICYWMV